MKAVKWMKCNTPRKALSREPADGKHSVSGDCSAVIETVIGFQWVRKLF